MFYTKSQAAFLLTCKRLFTVWPHPYFWTFTFRKVMPDWWYPQHWHQFIQHLSNLHGGMLCGVRVIEPHEQHGLHYHAIVNVRVSIHLVNRVARKYGIGRCSVACCNFGAAEYLVPYLKPNSENSIYKGMRRWGTIGGFVGVKTNAIEVDSPFHRNMALLNHGRKVGFKICNEVFRFSQLFGDFAEWSPALRAYGRAISNERVDRSAVLMFQRGLPENLRKVANEFVVTKPGMRQYRLEPAKTWDTIRKLHKPMPEEKKVMQHNSPPVKIGRIINVNGRWYDETQVKFQHREIRAPVQKLD